MSESEHDTIDLEEEVGDIDALLADAQVPAEIPIRGRRAGIVELGLVGIANAIWAVVGLVLWLPQAIRAVLGAALRVIHSALTHQSSDRAIAGIKSVSRLYVDRFLRRKGDPVFVGRRHEPRVLRLLGEVVWIGAFYLLLLRWLAPTTFAPIWQRLVEYGHEARSLALSAFAWSRDVASGLSSPVLERWQTGLALAAVLALGLLVGRWLGRRRR